MSAVKPSIDHHELLLIVVPLFSREPGLANKLLALAEGKPLAEQISSFFDHLFVAASRNALRANYNIISYRLRDVNERDPQELRSYGDMILDCTPRQRHG